MHSKIKNTFKCCLGSLKSLGSLGSVYSFPPFPQAKNLHFNTLSREMFWMK